MYADITPDQLYSEHAPYMENLLTSLAKTEIEDAKAFKGGTQFKFWMKLADGNTALVKPMRLVFGQFLTKTGLFNFGIAPYIIHVCQTDFLPIMSQSYLFF